MRTKKMISLIISLILILSLTIPVNAEDTEISSSVGLLDELKATDDAIDEDSQNTDIPVIKEVPQETNDNVTEIEDPDNSMVLPNPDEVTEVIENGSETNDDEIKDGGKDEILNDEATGDEITDGGKDEILNDKTTNNETTSDEITDENDETTTDTDEAPAVLSPKQSAKRMSELETSKASGQQWEMESNDSMNTANRIYPNTSCSGYLSSYNDTDWYQFTTGSNGYISVTLNHTYIENNNNYWEVNLYRGDGNKFYDMTVSGHETSKRSCRIGLPAGTYYVQITDGYGFSNVNYNLRINYVAANYWETEFNDMQNTADSISPNKSVTASLMSSSDTDWYKFTTKSNGYISMTLNHTYIDNGNSYWNVNLRKSDGSNLYNMSVSGRETSQRSCRIGLPAGTYYVQITDGYWYSDSDYNLRINYVAAGYWETEANDTKATADNIAPNASVTASLMSSSDTDYYKFTTKSAGYISLTINHSYIDSGSSYWTTSLYRASDGALLNEAYFYGNVTSGKTCRIGIPAGSYYVQVTRGYYLSDIDYNLRVNYVADSSYETELNDTPATADTIKKNVVSRGTLMTDDDNDYYTFTLASKCYVNFRLTHGYIDDDYYNYFHLTVSNRSNSPMMEYFLKGTETGTNQGMVLPAGTYYVKISTDGWTSSHSTTPYGILVQPILK